MLATYDGRVVLYVIKGRSLSAGCVHFEKDADVEIAADETSYINYIKPLILAEELQLPYIFSVIDTKDEWYYSVHPERYVPALKDRDPDTSKDFFVFESTACLQHLAGRFDTEGLWTGRSLDEKAAVLSWTSYQTAGLG